MVDRMLERYDPEAGEETWPNAAPQAYLAKALMFNAAPRVDIPVTMAPVSRLRKGLPYLVGGLALGLMPIALVVAFGFLVDYSALGAGWYGAMVFWGCAYVGGGVGVVATYFGMVGK